MENQGHSSPAQLCMPPDKEKDVDVGNVEVQIKQDPTDDNNFRLHLGGKRVFQWFKEKWQALKQSVKRGFGIR